MSLFRRKLESKKTPDESSGAQASSRPGEEAGPAEERVSSPSDEQAAATEQAAPSRDSEKQGSVASEPTALRRELHRGSIAAPTEGTFVGGTIEIEASLAEGASNTGARLEWSQDEMEWNPVELPGDDYELLAARAGAISSRIALVRSIELAEAKKLSLEQEGYERVELSPARPSSWQGRQRFHVGFDTASLSEGSCFLRLVTISAEGVKVASDPVRVFVDNVAPTVRLHEELAGKTLSGAVTLAADAEDSVSGVSVVELEVSGAGESWRRIAEARQKPFALRWSTADLADGTYRLRVVARDGSGNLGLGEPVVIEIANAPVAAELVDPGELLHGQVNLIARTPDLRSTQMIFEIAVAGSNDWRALGTTRAPFHLSVDTRQLVDGSYELRIESVTAEGQSVHSKRFGPYTIDNTPPSIAIAQPAKGEILQGRVELVVKVADDASGPARVELSYSEEEEWKTLAELEPEEGEVRGFWQVDECRPGSCRLRATAFDRAGNEASEVIEVTIAAPAASGPEPAPERESIPLSPARDEPSSVHRFSPAAAGRFGQVPAWDWQRLRSPAAAHSDSVESSSAEADDALEPSSESASDVDAEARPIGAAEAKEQGKKSVAWTWEKPLPRSEPEATPEPEAEEKPGPKQESEPEEQDDLIEEEPVQDIRLVEPIPDEEQEKAEQESEDKPKDSGAEEGGRVVNVNFARAARGWDIWELSELVEETLGQDPAREEERRQILYHLREHTSVDGRIPPEFESLIYDVFGELIPGNSGT